MPTRKTKSRRAAYSNFLHLASCLREQGRYFGEFEFSKSFVSNKNEESPLDYVIWNETTRRYEMPPPPPSKKKGGGSTTSKFTIDDCILQSMVMLLLARLDKGWGAERMCRELSIWTNNDKKPNLRDDLLNLWKQDIDEWISQKKLGKNMCSHHDNYDSFSHLFMFSCGKLDDRWNRRSSAYLSQLHVLAEQATIQWALASIDDDPHLPNLALCILKVFFGTKCNEHGIEPTEVRDICDILFEVAEKNGDHFVKDAMYAIENDQTTTAG